MTRDPPATDAPSAPCLQVPKCPHTTGQPGQTGQRKRLCCWRTPCPCHPALARPLSDLTTAPPKAPHSAIRAAGCWLLALRALPQNQRATERPLYHKARAAQRNTDQEARWRPSDSSETGCTRFTWLVKPPCTVVCLQWGRGTRRAVGPFSGSWGAVGPVGQGVPGGGK